MFLSLARRVLVYLAVLCLISFALIFIHSIHEGYALSWKLAAGAIAAGLVVAFSTIAMVKADDYLIPPHTAAFFITTALLTAVLALSLLTFFVLSDSFPTTYLLYFGVAPTALALIYGLFAVVRTREAFGLPPEYRAEPSPFVYGILPLGLSIPALLVAAVLLALSVMNLSYESRFDASLPDREQDLDEESASARRLEANEIFEEAKARQEENQYRRSFELFQHAATFDHPEADYELALIYSGDGFLRDEAKAVDHFETAAANGHIGATFQLGKIHRHGELTVERDFAKAREYLTRAAEAGHLEAQSQLGYMYNRGEGGEIDREQAFFWFLQAAEQGDPVAQNDVGIFYSQGIGVEENTAEAMRWIGKAAEQGVTVAEYNFSRALYAGELVPRDYEQAFVYFQRLAEKNIPYGFQMMGQQYWNGHGVEQDYSAAFEAFQEGASRKDAVSTYYLAVCYLEGHGTEKNSSSGLQYLEAAVDLENTDAKFLLGKLYLEGEVILQDKVEAERLLRAAAADGHTEATRTLEAMGAAPATNEPIEVNL